MPARPELRAIWYESEPLMRRMYDEVYRARRHRVEFSVILITMRRQAGFQVREILQGGFRQIDFAGMIDEHQAAFGLPHTGRAGALVVRDNIVPRLYDFVPLVGVATAPEDGETPYALLMAAEKKQEGRDVILPDGPLYKAGRAGFTVKGAH